MNSLSKRIEIKDEIIIQEDGKRILGEFRISKIIGEGTFGKVYMAIHLKTNEKVAIKVLNKASITINKDTGRVHREMSILKKLNHVNIARLYYFIETKKYICFVIEYCNGQDLGTLLSKKRYFKEIEAVDIFSQVVSAVDYLHKNNIIHRDLKLENILIMRNGEVKLIDFGLSNIYEFDFNNAIKYEFNSNKESKGSKVNNNFISSNMSESEISEIKINIQEWEFLGKEALYYLNKTSDCNNNVKDENADNTDNTENSDLYNLKTQNIGFSREDITNSNKKGYDNNNIDDISLKLRIKNYVKDENINNANSQKLRNYNDTDNKSTYNDSASIMYYQKNSNHSNININNLLKLLCLDKLSSINNNYNNNANSIINTMNYRINNSLMFSNVLLNNFFNFKLKFNSQQNINTESKPVSLLKTSCGSPSYASPEIIKGELYNPIKSDIWSLGIVLFTMVTGVLPFSAQTEYLLFKKIVKGEYTIPLYLSNSLKLLISKMLVVDVTKRLCLEDIKKHDWVIMFTPLLEKCLSNGVIPGLDFEILVIIEEYFINDLVKKRENKETNNIVDSHVNKRNYTNNFLFKNKQEYLDNKRLLKMSKMVNSNPQSNTLDAETSFNPDLNISILNYSGISNISNNINHINTINAESKRKNTYKENLIKQEIMKDLISSIIIKRHNELTTLYYLLVKKKSANKKVYLTNLNSTEKKEINTNLDDSSVSNYNNYNGYLDSNKISKMNSKTTSYNVSKNTSRNVINDMKVSDFAKENTNTKDINDNSIFNIKFLSNKNNTNTDRINSYNDNEHSRQYNNNVIYRKSTNVNSNLNDKGFFYQFINNNSVSDYSSNAFKTYLKKENSYIINHMNYIISSLVKAINNYTLNVNQMNNISDIKHTSDLYTNNNNNNNANLSSKEIINKINEDFYVQNNIIYINNEKIICLTLNEKIVLFFNIITILEFKDIGISLDSLFKNEKKGKEKGSRINISHDSSYFTLIKYISEIRIADYFRNKEKYLFRFNTNKNKNRELAHSINYYNNINQNNQNNRNTPLYNDSKSLLNTITNGIIFSHKKSHSTNMNFGNTINTNINSSKKNFSNDLYKTITYGDKNTSLAYDNMNKSSNSLYSVSINAKEADSSVDSLNFDVDVDELEIEKEDDSSNCNYDSNSNYNISDNINFNSIFSDANVNVNTIENSKSSKNNSNIPHSFKSNINKLKNSCFQNKATIKHNKNDHRNNIEKDTPTKACKDYSKYPTSLNNIKNTGTKNINNSNYLSIIDYEEENNISKTNTSNFKLNNTKQSSFINMKENRFNNNSVVNNLPIYKTINFEENKQSKNNIDNINYNASNVSNNCNNNTASNQRNSHIKSLSYNFSFGKLDKEVFSNKLACNKLIISKESRNSNAEIGNFIKDNRNNEIVREIQAPLNNINHNTIFSTINNTENTDLDINSNNNINDTLNNSLFDTIIKAIKEKKYNNKDENNYKEDNDNDTKNNKNKPMNTNNNSKLEHQYTKASHNIINIKDNKEIYTKKQRSTISNINSNKNDIKTDSLKQNNKFKSPNNEISQENKCNADNHTMKDILNKVNSNKKYSIVKKLSLLNSNTINTNKSKTKSIHNTSNIPNTSNNTNTVVNINLFNNISLYNTKQMKAKIPK